MKMQPMLATRGGQRVAPMSGRHTLTRGPGTLQPCWEMCWGEAVGVGQGLG